MEGEDLCPVPDPVARREGGRNAEASCEEGQDAQGVAVPVASFDSVEGELPGGGHPLSGEKAEGDDEASAPGHLGVDDLPVEEGDLPLVDGSQEGLCGDLPIPIGSLPMGLFTDSEGGVGEIRTVVGGVVGEEKG